MGVRGKGGGKMVGFSEQERGRGGEMDGFLLMYSVLLVLAVLAVLVLAVLVLAVLILIW